MNSLVRSQSNNNTSMQRDLIEQFVQTLNKAKFNPTTLRQTMSDNQNSTLMGQQFDELFQEKLRCAYKLLFNKDISVSSTQSLLNQTQSVENKNMNYFIHANVRCNICQKEPIIGVRYQSKVNTQINYCQECSQSMDQKYLRKIGCQDFDKSFVSSKICEKQIDCILRKKYRKQQKKTVSTSVDRKVRALPYKCKLTHQNPDVLVAGTEEEVVCEFSIQNHGQMAWPQDVELYSVSGLTEGQSLKIKPLESGCAKAIEIAFKAPRFPGNYESVWRVVTHEDGIRKCFGPKIYFFIRVVDQNNQEDYIEEQEEQQEDSMNQSLNQNTLHRRILSKAREVQSILGGEMKVYFKLIKERGLEDAELDDIIELLIA